ncbi:MAG: hypothetical protein H0V00_19915 [Chloroflexia bacterium]|nr:hypothetical protein [Chloroflexia bacterium]
MNAETMRDTTQEPLDDEERELMDPDTWDWDTPIEGRTIGTPGAILRVRFSREEFRDIEHLAKSAGVGPVELVRQTMLDRVATVDPRRNLVQQPAGRRRAATG